MGASRYLQNEGIWIASGEVANTSHINKFGYQGTDGGTGTIWDANGTTADYPYPAAGVASSSSTSGDDTGEGLEIQGLDENYNPLVVTTTVGATTTETFSRIFRVRKTTATNVGVISVNIGASLAAQILAGNGQTLMAVYTIPAGKTGYLIKFQGSMDKQNVDVKFKLFARPFGGAFNLKGQWGTQGGNSVTYDYPVPLKFEEKTDIKVNVDSGTAGHGAIFDLILVDK